MSVSRPNTALYLLLAVSALFALPVLASWSPDPDPRCDKGVQASGVCCPPGCGVCGSADCVARGKAIGSKCCVPEIRALRRDCLSRGAPCRSVEPVVPPPDTTCKRGLLRWKACCPAACKVCGGPGCWERGLAAGTLCCTAPIRALASCEKRGPPCSFVGLTAPNTNAPTSTKASTTTAPVSTTPTTMTPATGSPATNSTSGMWQTAAVDAGRLTRRHEACAVMVDGLVFLLGGRGAGKAVSVYDPKTRAWTNRPGLTDASGAPVELHHMQCVGIGHQIWIVASWTGPYPFEQASASGYVYDTRASTWGTVPTMAAHRRRGGAAAVRRGDFIYVVGGNRGGHGAHAQTLGWMDAFNWQTRTWVTGVSFPDLPVPRDHTGGAIVNDRLCVASGRDGGKAGFFWQNRGESFCYDFAKGTWVRVADLPTPRGGANVGRVCGGHMMVAGGEGRGKAYTDVHVFDGRVWKSAPPLREARHGSGVATADCGCGHVFIPSGSGRQGGWPELFTTEQFIPSGMPATCTNY